MKKTTGTITINDEKINLDKCKDVTLNIDGTTIDYKLLAIYKKKDLRTDAFDNIPDGRMVLRVIDTNNMRELYVTRPIPSNQDIDKLASFDWTNFKISIGDRAYA